MSTRRFQRGLNIIEMMIAIAIISMLLVFAVPMYRVWLQNSQLRASAESIMSALQFARTEAVRLNEPQGVSFALAGNDWTVARVSDASILRQGAGADLATNASVAADPAANTTVVFTALGRTNPAVNVNFNISHVNSADKCVADGGDIRCLRVQVRRGGLVRLCDPSVATAGDPRLCLP